MNSRTAGVTSSSAVCKLRSQKGVLWFT